MIAVLGLLLQLGQAHQPTHPRWTSLHDVRLGGSVDDILAKGGECRPGDAVGPLGSGMSVYSFAQMSFGYALPHPHQPSDSVAIRRALSVATLCWAPLDSNARALAAAVDRRLVAIIVYFLRDSVPLPPDSVRAFAYAAWGRPMHHSPTLDTWSSPHYRSYFLVPYVPPSRGPVPPWVRTPQLIMLDIAACTAFDARAHRSGIRGEAGEC